MNPNEMATPISKERTPTLAEWLQEWFETYKKSTLQMHTAQRQQMTINLICRCAESRTPLKKCSEKVLAQLMADLQGMRHHGQLYSKSSLKKAKETLCQSLTYAKQLRLIPENIYSDLKTPIAPEKKVLPLSHRQQLLIEQACQTDKLGHLIIFLLRTGLRRSELSDLTWEDYDPDKKTIHIRKSKTQAGIRAVCLLQEAQQIIEQQPKQGKYIFHNTRSTKVSDSIRKRF